MLIPSIGSTGLAVFEWGESKSNKFSNSASQAYLCVVLAFELPQEGWIFLHSLANYFTEFPPLTW